MIEDCTAIILAGGDSQRMGSDKANLLLGDQTLLQHVTAAMRQIFPQVVVSVRRPRPEIELPQVCDEQSNQEMRGAGPLAGLAAGIAQITTPWAFTIACDMPFMDSAMVELLSKYRGQYQAVVPVVQDYPQPLAAFYSTRCLSMMRAGLAGQDKSLRRMLKQLDVCYVDEEKLLVANSSLHSFFDLDTPQDVAMAIRSMDESN